METLLGDDAQWSLICIAGPDVGKQIEFARGEDVILGSAPIDGVISEDPGVDAGHVVFRIRDGRPVFRVAPGHPEVELDGQQVARGRLRMGQMLRVSPRPRGGGETTTRDTPSASMATETPTMSTIASSAPTSWKTTSSSANPCAFASASASRRKASCARAFTAEASEDPSIRSRIEV